MKIAVLTDKEGKTLSFYESGFVKLFSNDKGTWNFQNGLRKSLSR